MDFAFTKMSSKGQVVIPAAMRRNLAAGEKLVIIRDEDRLIMKKASALEEDLKDDLEFARRTEEAYRRWEEGKFIHMDGDSFDKELETW